MKTVKFNTPGKWAEVDPREPQFEVEEGDEREVSDDLAEIIIGADRGEIIDTPEPEESKENSGDDEDAELAKLEAEEVEKLKAEALELITELKLDVNDYNLGLDSEGLTGLVTNLKTMQEEAKADAEKNADTKKSSKKTPATKDKNAAESK